MSIISYEVVNVGVLPNDGEGDPLRVAFQKINNNFANLYSVYVSNTEEFTVGTGLQEIFNYPTANFTHGIFQIRSSNPTNSDSQDITLQAQINNENNGVKFSAYGTTFFGNALTGYDMAVVDGNVKIYADPIVNYTLFHFITSRVTWAPQAAGEAALALDGYPETSLLATENLAIITTENP